MRLSLLYLFLLFGVYSCGTGGERGDAYGTFEADEYQISTLHPGEIIYSIAREGMRVDSGELLAITDTTAIALQMTELNAREGKVRSQFPGIASQIEVLETQLENLQNEKKRFTSLVENGAATQKSLDDIRARIDKIKKQIASVRTRRPTLSQELTILEEKRKQLKNRIEDAMIYAPIDGHIMEVYRKKGEISPRGRTLFTIAAMDTLILRVYVSEIQLSDIQLNQNVLVKADESVDSMLSVEGNIVWIADEAEFTPTTIQTREERVDLVYAVKIMVPNSDQQFKIGMPAEVEFSVNKTTENASGK